MALGIERLSRCRSDGAMSGGDWDGIRQRWPIRRSAPAWRSVRRGVLVVAELRSVVDSGRTAEELRLKRRFALVFLRWLALLMVTFTGVGGCSETGARLFSSRCTPGCRSSSRSRPTASCERARRRRRLGAFAPGAPHADSGPGLTRAEAPQVPAGSLRNYAASATGSTAASASSSSRESASRSFVLSERIWRNRRPPD